MTVSKVPEPAVSQQSVSERRIRELAYQIWETEGCPHGQSDRHWNMARKLAEIEIREEPKPAARARRINKPKAAPLAGAAPSDAPIILPPPPPRSRTTRNKLDA